MYWGEANTQPPTPSYAWILLSKATFLKLTD